MKAFLTILIIVFSVSAYAELYKTVGPDGSISYSDMPGKGSVEFTAPPVNEVPSTLPVSKQSESSAAQSSTPEDVNSKVSYKAFAIESPKNQDTIQNQSDISVVLKVDPDLQAGDKIQILLDGQPVGAPEASKNITISNVNRGAHQLSAIILDSGNKIVKKTAPITVYIHRASVLNNASALLTPGKMPTYLGV